jgi:uncharacterized heparinase superfamily protein
VRDVLRRADRLCLGQFDLLGYEGLAFGEPIDWQLDPVSDRRASTHAHWSTVPYLRYDVVGDHKVTWELNRQQWLVTLAQAWRVTADPRYAATAAGAMRRWIADNPSGRGINWASSLELAMRAIAWLWTLHLLRDAPRPDAAERRAIVGCLRVHGTHIARHLSTWFSPNTHLTGEALGLLYLGVAVPSLPRASQWRRLGLDVLARETERQVRPDGTYFEQTLWYQGYTADFLLHALRLARHAGMDVPAAMRARTEAAAVALLHGLRPDGEVARIGDDDGGRLCGIDALAPADHRTTIGLATLEFGWPERPALLREPPAALAWVAGTEGLAELRRRPPAPPLPSRGFVDGGLYRLAHADGACILIDAGPHGALTGAHAHADAMSFEWWARDRAIVVDAGTGAYVGPVRDRLRRTAAHNTLVLDGNDSSIPAGPFRWARTASVTVHMWHSAEGWDWLDAEHDGFSAPAAPRRHRRRVLRLDDAWLLLDEWSAERRVAPEVRLHVAPGLRVLLEGTRAVVVGPERDATPLLTIASDVPLHRESAEVSPLYGRLEGTTALVQRPVPTEHGAVLTLLTTACGAGIAAGRLPAHAGLAGAWEIHAGRVSGALLLMDEHGHATWNGLVLEAPVAWLPRSTTDPVPLLPAGGAWRRETAATLIAGAG